MRGRKGAGLARNKSSTPAPKLKCVGNAKGLMPEESWKFALIVFLNPGEEGTEKFVCRVDFCQVFSLMEKAGGV